MSSTASVIPTHGSEQRAPAFWRPALSEMAAVATLALLPLLFFWRLVTTNLPDQAHIVWGDFGAQYYPLRLLVARELAHGRLPLWNPYLNGGQPALADAQSAVFYPPNLLLAFLAKDGELTIGAMESYVIIHFALAGMFTYLFARYALRSYSSAIARPAALFAAAAFAFGGYLTSFPIQQLTILEASVWLPLMLLFLDLAVERRSPWLFGIAALPVAISWSAGHAQTTMYSVYAALFYVLAKTLFGWCGWRDLAIIAGGVFSVGAGSALAAVQLLPTYEFLQLSTRVDLSYQATSSGMPLPELTGLLLPDVFGGRTLYLGVTTAALALLGILAGPQLRVARIWLAIGIVALLLSFGGNTFLYSALYLLAPGFAAVRNQERIVFLFSFAGCLLAGYGFATFLSRIDQGLVSALRQIRRVALWACLTSLALAIYLLQTRFGAPAQSASATGQAAEHAMFAALLCALTAGIIAMRLKGEWSPGSLVALALPLLLFDLFSVNWQANLVDAQKAQMYPPSTLTKALGDLPNFAGSWRISSEGLLPGGGSAASVYGLRDVVGNTPFQLKAFANVNTDLDETQRGKLLAVGHWLTKRQLDKDTRFTLRGEFGDTRLYEVGKELRQPRAYIVHATELVADDAAALRRVSAADLAKVAILSEQFGQQRLVAPNEEEPAPNVVVDTPTRQLITADLNATGVLVFSEVYYPGWRVFVNGDEAQLLRVQYLLRGVVLPPGHHQIEFRYEPASLRDGMIISVIAAGALILLWCAAALHHSTLGRRKRSVAV